MFSWFKKPDDPAPSSESFQKLNLQANIGTFEIPGNYTTEWDEDTLLFYPKDDPRDITFRISTISVVPKDDSVNCGVSHIGKIATEYNASIHGNDRKAWIHYTNDSVEDGLPSVIHFWHVGQFNSVVILSATVIKSAEKKRSIRDALVLAEKIVESICVTKHHRTFDDPDGKITITIEEFPSPLNEEARRPFEAEENEWLRTSLAAAAELSTRYGSGGAPTPADLDKIFSRWLHETGDKEPPELIIDALGAAFGQFFVDHHGFSWKVVIDQYGTEYAVDHPVGQNTAFPRSSIEKRIESGDEDFLHPIYRTVLQHLEERKQAP
jgi:hypothetical protein